MNPARTPRIVRRLARLAAWSGVAAVAFVTLSPIEDRPVLASQRVEHLGAFGTIGFLFGIAYPKRLVPILLTVVGTAGGLELAQHLVPGRHGKLVDFATKAAGGTLGIGVATMADLWLAARRQRRERERAGK